MKKYSYSIEPFTRCTINDLENQRKIINRSLAIVLQCEKLMENFEDYKKLFCQVKSLRRQIGEIEQEIAELRNL